MTWTRVIGQQWAKKVLASAISSNRLAHAYLFHGPEGVGKDALALELARVLHCEQGGEEACGTCVSCLQISALRHPDLKFVIALPVGKDEAAHDPPLAKLSDNDIRAVQEQLKRKAQEPYCRITIPRAFHIKINSVREVRREVALSTSEGKRRVVIISRADMMNKEAANALLKTLEEPTGHTILILTTARHDSLLPTIQSRCQHVRFYPLSEEEIRTALIERKQANPQRAATIARIASGSYGAALELLEENLDEERGKALSFVRSLLSARIIPFVEEIESMAAGRERDVVLRFLTLLLIWFRDAMVHAQGGEIINTDQAESIRKFVARFPEADLVRSLDDIQHAISLLRRNVYIMAVLLQLAVRLRSNILPGRRTGT
jgi:DNA polymerase-3 subunit delta'